MNNIERFKSGDKRLQVVVDGMPDEQKTLVQKGFSKLGWWFSLGVGSHLVHYDAGYTNQYSTSTGTSGHNLYRQIFTTDNNYPTTSFTELMILADMVDLPEVVQYLDEKELIKHGIKQEKSMKNNEFTKDMLEDGMFVRINSVIYMVLGDVFSCLDRYIPIDEDYDDNLKDIDDEKWSVEEVFTVDSEESMSTLKYFLDGNGLTSIWKRLSPEEVQRAEEKAELEKAILDAEENIAELKRLWRSYE